MCDTAPKLSTLSNIKWNISGLKVNWTLQNTQLTFLLSALFLVAELYAQQFFTTHKKTKHPKNKGLFTSQENNFKGVLHTPSSF